MKKSYLFYLLALVLPLFTCKDENNLIESQVFSESPVVKETKAAKSITRISAVTGGIIATTKGKTLISRGVCWAVTAAPTSEQNHSSDGKERGDFTSSITGLFPKTTYHVRAYAQTSDEIVYGPELTFETLPNNIPAPPTVPSPASGATGITASPNLGWTASDPDGDPLTYTVYFGTNSTPSTIIATNQSPNSISRSNLAGNTRYYWNIIAKDTFGASATSPIWSFTTGTVNNHPPLVPSNPSPASNLTSLQATNVQLNWSCSDPDGDALTYDIYFGTNSNPSIIVSANQTAQNYSPFGLTTNTIYYWKIVAKDGKGGTTEGLVWQFKTELPPNNPPETPSNPSPTNGSTNQPISLVLSWSCNDLDGDALTYDVYFESSSNPTVLVSTNQSSRNYTPPVLLTDITYYWKIIAKDNKGATKESSVWNFTTKPNDNKAPDAPTGPLPVNGSINRPLSLDLGWSCSDPDGDDLTYDVYFGTSSAPTDLISGNQTAKNYSVSGLKTNTTYYWKIVARDDKGATTEGPVWSFTSQSPVIYGTLVYNGFTYKTVVIGNQVWTVENLRTTTYNDGTPITKVTDNSIWAIRTSEAYCAYENNESNVTTYGYLYNWYAVNTGKLAPEGWRVPSDSDWTTLENNVGGSEIAGRILKAENGWDSGSNSNDDYGFKALPGGYRLFGYGTFYDYKTNGFWWTSTSPNDDINAGGWFREISGDYDIKRFNLHSGYGFSVRLVRDL